VAVTAASRSGLNMSADTITLISTGSISQILHNNRSSLYGRHLKDLFLHVSPVLIYRKKLRTDSVYVGLILSQNRLFLSKTLND
jgi:hypothetical protein